MWHNEGRLAEAAASGPMGRQSDPCIEWLKTAIDYMGARLGARASRCPDYTSEEEQFIGIASLEQLLGLYPGDRNIDIKSRHLHV